MRISPLVVIAALPFASCRCDDNLHSLPVPHAKLSIDDQSTPPKKLLEVNAPSVALGSTRDAVFTLENTGAARLDVTSIALGGDDTFCATPSGQFFLVGDPIVAVAAKSKALVTVRFAPTTAVPSCTVLTVASNDAEHPTLVAHISEQGDAAQLCADKTVVDFGDVVTGDHKDDTVTLTSCGTKPITLAAANENASFPDPFGATLPTLPATLDVGQTIALPVSFAPQIAGTWSVDNGGGVITFVDDAGAQYDIELIGTAHEPPRCHIQVVPDVVNLGQVAVGFTAQQTIVVHNIGALPCTFTSADVVGGDPFSRTLDTLTAGQTLAPQDSGTLTVTFAPTTAAGVQNDTLRVVSDDPVNATIDVPLQGNSVDVLPCMLQAVPTALNFGSETLNKSTTQTVSMQNIGTDLCMITTIELESGAPDFSIVTPALANLCSGPNPQIPPQFCQFFGDMFGTMVGPGEHVDFVVTFRPETVGAHTGDVKFTYKLQGPSNPDQTIDVPLSGSGTAPCITVSPQDVDFGTVSTGATSEKQVTVSNCGAGDLDVRGLSMRSSSHPDFHVAQASQSLVPFTLAAGASQIVSVDATPTSSNIAAFGAAMFGTLDVLSDADTASVHVRANTPACSDGLVCTPPSIDFGHVLTNEPAVRTLVCTNPTAHAINVSPTIAAPFTIVSAPASIGAGQDGIIRVRFSSTSAVSTTKVLDVGASSCAGGPVRVNVSVDASDNELPACPQATAFSPVQAWQWQGGTQSASSKMSWSTPLVSRLEDTDGDGQITRADMPRVILVTFDAADMAAQLANPAGGLTPIPAFLRAIDGKTGNDVWRSPDDADMKIQSESSPALADLDGDGRVEIVAEKFAILPTAQNQDPNNPGSVAGASFTGGYAHGNLIAFNFDGTFKWQSDEWTRDDKDGEDGGAPAIGDVDGDGYAEIAWADTLFDHNGHILWQGDHKFTGSTGHGSLPVLADVDGHAGLELVVGPRVYRNDGTILWSRDDLSDGHVAVADLDGDGKNEIVLRNDQLIVLNGQTGATLAQTTGGAGIPTNVALMDVDGDGKLEIVSAASPVLSVFDHNLHPMFQESITDQSGASGPAGFDFEGDGSQAIVYADEQNLFAYNASGQTIYSATRASATIFEYATIADVDNDGHADLLVVDNANIPTPSIGGVRCYKNQGTSWAQARGIWSQHAYVEALISELGAPLFESTPTPIPSFRAARARCQ